jgi:hypothetical protein
MCETSSSAESPGVRDFLGCRISGVPGSGAPRSLRRTRFRLTQTGREEREPISQAPYDHGHSARGQEPHRGRTPTAVSADPPAGRWLSTCCLRYPASRLRRFLLLSKEDRLLRSGPRINVETFRPAERKHALKVFSFRRMQSFHVVRSFHVTRNSRRLKPCGMRDFRERAVSPWRKGFRECAVSSRRESFRGCAVSSRRGVSGGRLRDRGPGGGCFLGGHGVAGGEGVREADV